MATDETFATRVDPVLVRMPDRCRLAARVFGPEDAPPVLFVAGGDGGMLQWRGLIPELCVDNDERELFAAAGGWGEAEDAAKEAGRPRSLAADLRVAAYDTRGTGWSSRSHGVCTTAGAAAADALALAGALFGGRFHLVGHGLGGAVALQVALAGPRLVASLTLISSTAGGDAFVPPAEVFFEVRAALADAVGRRVAEVQGASGADPRADDAELAELLRRDVELGFTPSLVVAHPALVDRLVAEARRGLSEELEFACRGATGTTAAAARGEQFATFDVVARLADVTAPTLVVHGAQDVVLPLGNRQTLADGIPGARLVTLDAGHAVTIERAGDVTRSLRAHVLLHP